ncbi:hypothetical protein ACM66B_005846 [Microbotryomycetes sp. NB124-2]
MALPGRPKQVVSDPLGSNKFVVGGGSDLRLYEWEHSKHVSRFNTIAACTELGQIRSFAVSPHTNVPNLVAAGLHAGRVILLRLDPPVEASNAENSPFAAQINIRHARPCNAVAFCEEQPGLLAVGLEKGRGESLYLYDIERSAAHMSRTSSGTSVTVPSTAAPASSDVSAPLLSAGSSESVSSAAFLATGSASHSSPLLAAGMAGKYLRVYDIRAARAVVATWGSRACHCVSADPFNGFQFVSSADDGIVRMWDIRKSMDPLVSFSETDAGAVSARAKPTIVAKALVEIGWSRSQRGILTTLERDSHSLRIWNIVEGAEVKPTEAETGEVSPSDRPLRLPVVLSDRRPPEFHHSLASFAFIRSPMNSLKTHFIGVSRDASVPGSSGHALEVIDVPVSHQAVFTSSGLVLSDSTTPAGITSFDVRPDTLEVHGSNHAFVMPDIPQQKAGAPARLKLDPASRGPVYRLAPSPQQTTADNARAETSRVFEMDAARVTVQRLEKGYGSDALVNARITESPLKEFWNWIARAELLARDSYVGEHDFRYKGALSLVNGSGGTTSATGSSQRSNVGARNPAASASPRTIYSDVTRSLRKGDEAQTKNAACADAIAQLVSRRKLDGSFATGSTSLANQRKLALQCCGPDWEEDQDLVSSRFAKAEDFESAARHAFFSGHLEKSMSYLKNCSSDSVKMLAPLLAAYLAQRDSKSADSHFTDLCRSLSSDMETPWMRAMLAFLASGDWRELVDETGLPLRDRVAVALRFLSDSELVPFLNELASEALASGDLEAVLLFGMQSDGLKLLTSYVDRTADVQTAALAAAFVSPGIVRDDMRVMRWLEGYRGLLDELRLFSARAMFDISHSRRARSAIEQSRYAGRLVEAQEVDKALKKAAPAQMVLRCQYCSANIAPSAQTLTAPGGDRSGGQVGVKVRRPPAERDALADCVVVQSTVCPTCSKGLPACSVCLEKPSLPCYVGARSVVMVVTRATFSNGSIAALSVLSLIAIKE